MQHHHRPRPTAKSNHTPRPTTRKIDCRHCFYCKRPMSNHANVFPACSDCIPF